MTRSKGRDIRPDHDDRVDQDRATTRRDTTPERDTADRATVISAPEPGRREVLARQQERFGGIKWGSAFFGWLTATGTALILTALAAAAGAVFGLTTTSGDPGQAAGQAAQDPATATTAGIVSAVVVLVVLLIAYYCGGYVAGRMARFNGIKQGLAVWLWAVIIAVVIAVLGIVAGTQYDILAGLGALPRLPINEGTLAVGGIIAAVVALVTALVGALLGGLAGMKFHRRVDRADLACGG